MELSLDEVVDAFVTLLDEHENEPEELGPGEGNFRCVDCDGCYSCRFCVLCRACEECTYCERCEGCTSCTQSHRCRDCTKCSHTEDSRNCEGCSYVTLCVECESCIQCFACVGLEGEEFCILNERYSRKDYFENVAKLREELTRRRVRGWRVPGIELSDGVEEVIEDTSTSPFEVPGERADPGGSGESKEPRQGLRVAKRPQRR